VFHDVVRGGNLLQQAGPGWDYSTGLGTPRVGPLADALISALGGQ
jgi:kumamolisin